MHPVPKASTDNAHNPPRLGATIIPQLIITLTPAGALQIELPGHNGARRRVECKPSEFQSTCLRILEAQSRSAIEIGLDGAPTQAQVRHWERHAIWTDPACPFCISEGRISATRTRNFVPEWQAGDGSVTVRRVKAKTKGKTQQRLQSMDDL